MTNYRNQLLRKADGSDLDLLREHLEFVELAARHQLDARNRPIDRIYFMETALASVVGRSAKFSEIEVGLIGAEGFTGLPIAMGTDRWIFDSYVQMPGTAWSLPTQYLQELVGQNGPFASSCRAFVMTFLIQVAATSIAASQAKLEERLARWLLMAADRSEEQDMKLTHEFLATMLGVRRSGVTLAMGDLMSRGLVSYGRGTITLTDRPGLEEFAANFYGAAEAEYERMLGASLSKTYLKIVRS
jgi:CRP-like cAMP-binding protein